MQEPSRAERKAKGVNLLGLVKLLRSHRHTQPLTGLAPELEHLVDQRILMTDWYPLEQLWGLLEFTYRNILNEDPKAAIAMGVAGGTEMWTKTHRAFLASDDPCYSLRQMKPAWHSYFNFGMLDVERVDDCTMRFRIRDYPDLPVYHGLTIGGWHVAAAQVGGWPDARLELAQGPWESDAIVQEYLVRKT